MLEDIYAALILLAEKSSYAVKFSRLKKTQIDCIYLCLFSMISFSDLKMSNRVRLFSFCGVIEMQIDKYSLVYQIDKYSLVN